MTSKLPIPILAALALAASVIAADRPNLIVIFTDDQTFRAIGYNNAEVKTPNLDRLAREGLILDNAYVASPICAASRASMMTGTYPQQHGVIALAAKNFDRYRSGSKLAGQTLAVQLGMAGYHCAYWGKSHLGNPKTFGFHEGTETGGYDDVQAFKAASAFLARAKAEKTPFFLWLAPRQPHVPLKPEQRWLDLYDEKTISLDDNFRESPLLSSINNQGKKGQAYYRDSKYLKNWRKLAAGPPREKATMRKFIKAYYAVISHLDHQVGQLMTQLNKQGLADNTTVIFLSDNGYHLGNHGLGNKITMHEESVRVPMFVWGAGVKAAGQRSSALVSSLDVYPTLLELAGGKAPEHAMGKSLLPVLADATATVRSVVFSECTGVGGKRSEGHRMARDDNWKYVLSDVDEEYLFDQKTDPYETNNVLASPNVAAPEALQKLRRAASEWMRAIGDRDLPR